MGGAKKKKPGTEKVLVGTRWLLSLQVGALISCCYLLGSKALALSGNITTLVCERGTSSSLLLLLFLSPPLCLSVSSQSLSDFYFHFFTTFFNSLFVFVFASRALSATL